MTRRFIGRCAIVTGASAGIGAAVARALVAEGAKVALAARGAAALEQIGAELRAAAGDGVVVIPTDVADPAQAGALIERAVAALGGLDILVNNAGANRRGPIEDFSAAELSQVVQVNLVAPIVLTRLALPHLRRRGGGSIVNVASLAGVLPVGRQAVYSATKFGLRAFTLALEEELQGTGIRASVVSPGPVDTGFIMDDLDRVSDLSLAQPLSSAEQVAALVLDCIADGKSERMIPAVSGVLGTLGYVLPGLRRLLLPMMQRRGRKNRERYRAERAAQGRP